MPEERAPRVESADGLDAALATLPASARAALELAVGEAGRLGIAVAWVGGGVRDLLLGRAHPDLDLVTEEEPWELATALAAALGGHLRTHSAFATATVLHPHGRIDLARSRRERYPGPAALPVVEPASLVEDLARRDFTVNAMALRFAPGAGRAPELLDPHSGRDDLAAKRLAILHEASFVDDPTRVLRGVGFELRLGFRFGDREVALARAALEAGGLERLSGARLWQALRRACERLATCARALGRLDALGAAAHFGPHPIDLGRAACCAEAVTRGAGGLEGLEVPAADALALALGEAVDAGTRTGLARRLALPAAAGRLVVAGAETVVRARAALLETELPHRAAELLEALGAAELAAIAAAPEPRAREWTRRWWADLRLRRSAISARDLLDAGARPGPEIGRALRAARRALLDGPLDRESELAVALASLREERG